MINKKRYNTENYIIENIVQKSATTRNLTRRSVYKTFVMTVIDIHVLLPKENDLATLTRDASSAPTDPETRDGSDATAKAALDSPSQNIPTKKNSKASPQQRRTSRGLCFHPSILMMEAPQWNRRIYHCRILAAPISESITLSG